MNSLKFYKSIVDSFSEGLIVTNNNSEIVFANTNLCKMFGYNENDLIGQPIEILIPKDIRKGHVELRDEYILNPRKRPHGIGIDVFAVKSDGSTFPVEISLSYFKEESQTYVISVVSDISKRKKKEQSIQKYISDTQELKNENVKVQLEVLKKQLGPHYLFNCLSILYSLITTDKERALKLCKKIAETYSYVLETNNQVLVNLADELKFLKNYLFLQEIRFQNSFILELDESLILKDVQIIPFGMQLLVENAFKHNIFSVNEKLIINISDYKDGILVTNNITTKRMINNSHGIGLNNLKRQYELLSQRNVVIEKKQHEFKVWIPTINP